MEDSGKSQFHGLERDLSVWLFKSHFHTSALGGYEAQGNLLKKKAADGKWKTGNVLKKKTRPAVMVASTDARAINFLRLTHGIGENATGKEKRRTTADRTA